MKTTILSLVLLLAMCAMSCTGTAQSSSKNTSTDTVKTDPTTSIMASLEEVEDLLKTTDKDLLHYAQVDSVMQVITVKYTGTTHCEVKMYEKVMCQGTIGWKERLSCPGNVGKNGMGKEKEGDMRTPTGDFGIITAFGIKPNPGTTLPYVDVVETTYCCGDTVAYNRIIDIKEVKHNCKGEHMINYVPAYNYGFFLDYNKDCTIGRGSAIFFHCTSNNPYTAGCIAVSEPNMVKILCSINKNARLIISK